MNIYRVHPDVACGKVIAVNDEDTARIWRRGLGKPGLADLVSLRYETFRGGKWLPAHFSGGVYHDGDGFLVNAQAREALAPLLSTCGEYIPASLEGYDYQWFHCTAWREVADDDRIEGERHHLRPDDLWNWTDIKRWAFHPDRLTDLPAIFRVPQRPITELLCTDVLKAATETNGLIGLEYTHLWSSEHGGTQMPRTFAFMFGEAATIHSAQFDARRAEARARLGLKPERKRTRRKPTPNEPTGPETSPP